MRRSACVILLLGLILPAVGQSDQFQPRGVNNYAPQGRSTDRRGMKQPGQASPAGNRPRGPQPVGNGYFPGNPGLNGPQGNSLQGYVPQGNPTQGATAGNNPPAGLPGQLPEKGFLLDARNARAKDGRVPNGFGQLGLSDEQRTRIYGIQALYDHHIERLEALIERLKTEEDVQYQYVLTPFQRRMYQRYLAEKEQGSGD